MPKKLFFLIICLISNYYFLTMSMEDEGLNDYYYQIETLRSLRAKLKQISPEEKERVIRKISYKHETLKNIDYIKFTQENVDEEGYLNINVLAQIIFDKIPFLQNYLMIKEKKFVRFFRKESQKNIALISCGVGGYYTKKMFLLGHLKIEENSPVIDNEIFYIKLVDHEKASLLGNSELESLYKINYDNKLSKMPINFNYPRLKFLEYGFCYNDDKSKNIKEAMVLHAGSGLTFFDMIVWKDECFLEFSKDFFRNFGESIRNLHNRSIIHGDISFSNAIMRKRNNTYFCDLVDLSGIKLFKTKNFSKIDIMLGDFVIRTFFYEIIRSFVNLEKSSVFLDEIIIDNLTFAIDGYIGADPLLNHQFNEKILSFYKMIEAIRKNEDFKLNSFYKENFWELSDISKIVKDDIIDLTPQINNENYEKLKKIIIKLIPLYLKDEIDKVVI